jgi:hypothetical protein
VEAEKQTSTAGLKDMISRDKARDMFKDCTRQVANELVKDDVQKWVGYKFKTYKIEKQVRKIRNLLKSKVITGPRYIMAWLKVYALVKQMFLLDFE